MLESGLRPSDKLLNNIRNFPRPTSLSDIRSWFGIIEQVSYGFSKTEVMLPFRHLLSQKNDFLWTGELQDSFDKAKEEIIKQVSLGVETFQIGKRTALITDWSKKGIGYLLAQKHCQCKESKIFCCKSGWRTVSLGSRFCNSAEQNYSPVEGELLAVVFGLEKTKIWTLGNPDLVIVVDHKPLLGLLKKRSLSDISNPRLAKLTEKTMHWNFQIQHLAGKLNVTSDALSRLPGKFSGQVDSDEESGLIGVIDVDKLAVTLDEVRKESEEDPEVIGVIKLLNSSIKGSSKDWGEFKAFFRFRHHLWQEDGVLW